MGHLQKQETRCLGGEGGVDKREGLAPSLELIS